MDIPPQNAPTRMLGRDHWRAARPARLSEDVATDVIERVIRGELVPRSVLPNESMLSAFYQVSRPVVREALKVVEQKGLVRIRRGDGTTVLPRTEWALLDSTILRLLLEGDEAQALRSNMISLRRDLEASMAAKSVGRLAEDDLIEMERLIDVLDSATDPGMLQAANVGFHDLIYTASGDDVSRAVVRQLVGVVEELTPTTFGRDHFNESNQAHRAIFGFLQSGDASAARDAMADHISAHWLFGNTTETAFPPERATFAGQSSGAPSPTHQHASGG
jgi:DNA-binding FadR family transcriptional regulator